MSRLNKRVDALDRNRRGPNPIVFKIFYLGKDNETASARIAKCPGGEESVLTRGAGEDVDEFEKRVNAEVERLTTSEAPQACQHRRYCA